MGGDIVVITILGQELPQCRADILLKCVIRHFRSARGHDHEIIGQQPIGQKIVERWKNHAPGEVAGGTE